jgi:membrane protease YdiL (CAAX protease family)
MRESGRAPWHPSQLDLTLGILILLILSLGLMHLDAKRRRPPQPPMRISLQARLGELKQRAKDTLGSQNLKLLPEAETTGSAWDRAHSAILVAETGDISKARTLAEPVPPGPAGEAFRRCWSAGYLQVGPIPDAADLRAVKHALRSGYAARLLEVRLLERGGQDGRPLREEAHRWLQRQFRWLMILGFAFLFFLGAGAIFSAFLSITWQRPPLRDTGWRELPGKGMLLVFLGWFCAYLASGTVAGLLVHLLPFLKPLSLPLAYSFHAFVGLGLICKVRDRTFPELLEPLFPSFRWNLAAWIAGFMLMAMTMVVAVSLIFAPLVRSQEPPQKELMEQVVGAAGLPGLCLMLLLVSVIAPIFEEFLFRGALLPWLEQRWGFRRGWVLALLVSSIAFGAIHLVPAALPGLSALGLVLGLAFLRTGHLASAVIVHGLWNGGVFLLYRFALN